MDSRVRLVRPEERWPEVASGSMTREAGISKITAGSEGIYMAVVLLPPGHSSTPHSHSNCESAIYVMSGQGKFLCGQDLGVALDITAGDCLYVPPGAVHQPVNDGTEPITLIVARNTQEEVVVEYRPGGTS